MTEVATQAPPVQQVIKVTRKDLPLSCPRPQDALWNMHPRVYLPIEDQGRGRLPLLRGQVRAGGLRRPCRRAAPRPPASVTTLWQRWWRDKIFPFAGGKRKDPDFSRLRKLFGFK